MKQMFISSKSIGIPAEGIIGKKIQTFSPTDKGSNTNISFLKGKSNAFSPSGPSPLGDHELDLQQLTSNEFSGEPNQPIVPGQINKSRTVANLNPHRKRRIKAASGQSNEPRDMTISRPVLSFQPSPFP